MLVCVFYLINVAQPFADVFEALGVGDVIDQHDAHGSSVVGGGDGVEPFLARCVPAHKQKQMTCLYSLLSCILLQPAITLKTLRFLALNDCKSQQISATNGETL